MTPELFVKNYYPFAKATERKKEIPAEAILVQAACESGWGESAPGNMFFGEKDFDGINGNEQLLTTTEYHTDAVHKYPVIMSIAPVLISGKKMFKYRIKDWFKKYATPEECFDNHADFFWKNKRYKEALAVRGDAVAFLKAVAKAGYATDPNYEKTLMSVLATIRKYTPKN